MISGKGLCLVRIHGCRLIGPYRSMIFCKEGKEQDRLQWILWIGVESPH